MGCAISTHFDACTVEAENPEDARGMAVRVAYQKAERRGEEYSHVTTGNVREA